MKHRNILRLGACAVLLAGAASATAADVDMFDGKWHYDVAPYLWFPGIKGTLRYTLPGNVINPPPSGSVSADVQPSKYLSSLQFGVMIAALARKDNFALYTDLVYTDFANLKSKIRNVGLPGGSVVLPLNQDVNMGVRATIWTAGASYTVARNDSGLLNLGGGFRYLNMHNSLDWNFSGQNGVLSRSGGAAMSTDIWDGIVPAQGNVRLSDDGKWILPYYADIGAGTNSNWTWQAYAGIAYKYDWGSVALLFRNLSYHGTGDDPVRSFLDDRPGARRQLSLVRPAALRPWRRRARRRPHTEPRELRPSRSRAGRRGRGGPSRSSRRGSPRATRHGRAPSRRGARRKPCAIPRLRPRRRRRHQHRGNRRPAWSSRACARKSQPYSVAKMTLNV